MVEYWTMDREDPSLKPTGSWDFFSSLFPFCSFSFLMAFRLLVILDSRKKTNCKEIIYLHLLNVGLEQVQAGLEK